MVIRFYILLVQLLPIALRKNLLLQWFNVAITPVQKMHDGFNDFNEEYAEKACINSQVIVLEDYLRRFFGTDEIYLLSGISVENPTVYHTEELQPDLIVYHTEEHLEDEIIFHTEESTAVGGIIQVPAFLETKEQQLKAILKQNLFASATYKIEYV